ncbi:sodium-dependent phosphate transporter 2-like [Ptychodera flava]|uniref:sodium-dependent phosphate transporter 2-like n=1 Tax=Ptychodera flava TaxID=63121 RepID=UPI00396A530C
MYVTSVSLTEYLWVLIVGFIIAFILAFVIGANDVANSFATSVGSKVLTLRGACILATIFETAGAVLLGSKVSSTIRQGIFNISLYEGQEEVLMLGEVSALGGSFIWLFIATFVRLPVSTTHSIVGAMIGFHLVVFGTYGLHWNELIKIVISWFTSPALSGVISCILFVIVKWCIIDQEDSVKPGLMSLPIFYALTITINTFSIFYNGPEMLGFDKIPLWGAFVLSFGVGIIVAIAVQIFAVPWMRKKIEGECSNAENEEDDDERVGLTSRENLDENQSGNTVYGTVTDHERPKSDENDSQDVQSVTTGTEFTDDQRESQKPLQSTDTEYTSTTEKYENAAENGPSLTDDMPKDDKDETENKDKKEEKDRGKRTDPPEVAILFKFLQILSACFGGFAHGGNDVSNAIGPLTALWFIYKDGSVSQETATPLWILLYGGVGISIGLWVWGYRVIQTVGEDLTVVTPSSGFTIELGSATTVLMASNIGVPISSTHCKIGSVVSVGWVRERRSVDWRLFMNIVIAWFITVPASGAVSAGLMAILLHTV